MKKLLLALILLFATSVLMARFIVRPFQCNRMIKQLRARAERGFRAEGSFLAVAHAHEDIISAIQCTKSASEKVEAYMIAAANLRLLGRPQEAVSMYQLALNYDRRPELYVNLGQTLIQAGHREEGLQMLVLAARFLGEEGMIDYRMDDVPEREEVKARLKASDR